MNTGDHISDSSASAPNFSFLIDASLDYLYRTSKSRTETKSAMPFNEAYEDDNEFFYSNQQPATLLVQEETSPPQAYLRSISSLSTCTEIPHNHNDENDNHLRNFTRKSTHHPHPENISIDSSSSFFQKPWFDCNHLRWIPQRHLVLFAFCLNSASNGFSWVQYTVLNDLIIEKLGISQQLVDFTSLVYMLVYTIGALPASHIQERYGLRLAIFLGTSLTLLGSLIKCFTIGLDVVQAIILGQIVVSIAQLFILGIPSHLAAVWYPQSQQNTATAIAVFANSFGVAASFLIPPIVISADNFVQDLYRLHSNLACIAAIVLLFVLLFVRSSPNDSENKIFESTSASSSKEKINRIQTHKSLDEERRKSITSSSSSCKHRNPSLTTDSLNGNGRDSKGHLKFWVVFRRLLNQKSYVLLLFTYGISLGISSAFATILPRLLEGPNSRSETPSQISKIAGQLGLVYVFSGLVGILAIGRLLDRGRRYKLSSILLNAGACLGLFQFAWLIRSGYDYRLLFPSIILTGYCWTAFLMMGYEFAAEITYPLPESISAAILNISSQFFGVICVELSEMILDWYGVWTCNVVFLSILAVITLLCCLITDRLPRQAAYDMFNTK